MIDAIGCHLLPPLLGHVVGVTGHRRVEELTSHLRALGASVLHGPVLHTRPIVDDDRALRAATEAVIARPPDYLLATTGIGIRSWCNAAASWGGRDTLLDALHDTRVLARGPKVRGAIAEAGLPVWFTEPSGQSDAMVDHLLQQPLAGRHVAVQVPGADMPDLVERIAAAGAAVTSFAVYDWTWPDDLAPPRRLVQAVVDGRVSAVTFTSRPAVRNFVALAQRDGLDDEVRDALRSTVVPVCVGTVTADALLELTGATAAVPNEAMLGMLVQTVADQLRRRRHRHVRTPTGDQVVVQGRLVVGAGTSVTTSEREAAVLNRLVVNAQRTVSRDELLTGVWRSETVDPSVLDTTMARLRRRLAPSGLTILTITGRGYLLNGDIVGCPDEVDTRQGRDNAPPPMTAVGA